MPKTADAVIIGGGVMGCSILYNLAARGMKGLVLLEREVLGYGSTGKSQAICRMHYSNEVTARMAWESLKVYRSFQEVIGGPSGFVNTGYLAVVGPEDRQALEDNVAMQRALGINTRHSVSRGRGGNCAGAGRKGRGGSRLRAGVGLRGPLPGNRVIRQAGQGDGGTDSHEGPRYGYQDCRRQGDGRSHRGGEDRDPRRGHRHRPLGAAHLRRAGPGLGYPWRRPVTR